MQINSKNSCKQNFLNNFYKETCKDQRNNAKNVLNQKENPYQNTSANGLGPEIFKEPSTQQK